MASKQGKIINDPTCNFYRKVQNINYALSYMNSYLKQMLKKR